MVPQTMNLIEFLLSIPAFSQPMEYFDKNKLKVVANLTFKEEAYQIPKCVPFVAKNGRTVDTCYFKHDFPPSLKFKDKT